MKEEFTKRATEINAYLKSVKTTISPEKLEEMIRHMRAFNYNCTIVKEAIAKANGPIQGLIYDKSFKEAELRLYQDLLAHPGKRRKDSREISNILTKLRDERVADVTLESKVMTEFNAGRGALLSLLYIDLQFPLVQC